jgi:hypothetical protein
VRNGALVILLFLASAANLLVAQEDFYDGNSVREIRLLFPYPDWQYKLDSLFTHEGDEGRLECTVIIDGFTYEQAGARYKGYSSYNASERKNPFNIDLDYKIANQNHLGQTKLKLSNVIHDPSFAREVLGYEIARKYLPAPRANFANLYVNDTLVGLYTNVEAVDKRFLKRNYQTDENSFFKGEPNRLEYPFGQNSNLALSHGADSSGYMGFYKMESAAGWGELLQLIRQLDGGADSVSTHLNIDRTLWMHAFNQVFVNLDSYIGYSQNYYLYKDANGQFNPIPWDLNMSFGSFRESDGSYHFNGLTIDQCKELDPLEHLSFTISPRPLMTKLLDDDRCRKIYFAHMRTLLKENVANGFYYQRAQAIQELIADDVAADTNKFYSLEDFHANMDNTVGGAGDMIEYPGLRDLMEGRLSYLDTLAGMQGEPIISGINYEPAIVFQATPMYILCQVDGASNVSLAYRFASSHLFQEAPLFDDGSHYDGAAGDKVYGAMLVPDGKIIQYYVVAENETAAALSPERAAFEFYTIQPQVRVGDVVINEVKVPAENPADDSGWIEIFNTTQEKLDLNGFTLMDATGDQGGYVLPDTAVEAGGYFMVHFGYGLYDSAFWSSILLPSSGGKLWLLNAVGSIIDSVMYGTQIAGKSIGRYPNGYGGISYMQPTYRSHNSIGTTPSTGFLLYPNPTTDITNIEIRNATSPVSVVLFNTLGQKITETRFTYQDEITPSIVQPLDVFGLERGIYIVKVTCNQSSTTKKLIID